MISPRAALTALALTLITSAAGAQTPPPAAPPAAPTAPSPPQAPSLAAVQAPPAGYAPPPPGYAPAPPGYAPAPPGYGYGAPPGYAYAPPPGYAYGSPMILGPETLPYQEGYPIPDGYRPGTRRRAGLIVAGAVTFGAVYLLNAAGAAAGGDNTALFVPVLGPFIEIGHLNSSPLTGLAGLFLVLDGLTQAGGVAMFIGGMASTKQVLVRRDVAKTTVRFTPLTMGYAGAGLGIGLVGEM